MARYNSPGQSAMRGVAVAGLAATLGACDQPPRPPTTPTQTVALTALRISGPEILPPGGTAQFTAIADYADGTSADVTAKATFQQVAGSPRVFLGFAAGGLAQVNPGGDSGFSKVRALLDGFSTVPRTVYVMPPGTFRLHGAMTEEGQADDLNAAVEIVGGTGVGIGLRAQRTENQGQYAFYGVAGDLEVRASVAGYEPQTHRINVTATMRHDIDLQPLVPTAGVSGAWRLTVSPSPFCATILPAGTADRVLDVQIVQAGGNVEAVLSGPTVFRREARHAGRVLGQALWLELFGREFDTYVEATVFDRLSPTQWLGISGIVRGTVVEPEFAAVLSGQLDLYVGQAGLNAPPFIPGAQCRADHAVTFRRK